MESTELVRELSSADFADMKKWVGVDLRIDQFNEEATSDTIRHYAMGIGDDNPLWIDKDHAAKSRFGRRPAPPTFLTSVFDAQVNQGVPDFCQPFHTKSAFEFPDHILIGDAITASARVLSVEERVTKNAGLTALVITEATYVNQRGERVGRIINTLSAIVRQGAGLAYPPRFHSYSDAELEDIRRQILAEEVRGSVPRYWEDVQEGEAVPPVIKGPHNQMAMTCYYQGSSGSATMYRALGPRVRYQERLRRGDPTLANNLAPWLLLSPHEPAVGHQNSEAARKMGMPGAYDSGNQRCGYVAHAVTNWMGDDGDMLKLMVEIRRPHVYGDTTWFSGTVERKYVEDGRYLVDMTLSGVNQLGEENTRGSATVALPRRG
jgi:acyl dehydratase